MEAIIHFIEALRQFYDSTFASVNMYDLLTTENYEEMRSVIGNCVPSSIREMLMKLSVCFQFKTTRIECLIKNLFERKQNSRVPSQQHGELREVSEHRIRELLE